MTFLVNAVAVLIVTARFSLASESESVVELSCNDNATCIDNLAKELIRNVKEGKAVKVFDTLTIEPVADQSNEESRGHHGAMARFLGSHALTWDLGPYSLKMTKATGRSAAVEVEVLKEEKAVKGRRRQKKVMQMILPLILGMKSASTVIVAMTAVAMLVFKAFMASKLALIVTVGMAAKRLMEGFGNGVGLQHHPYLYSHYPVDFPATAAAASGHPFALGGPAYGVPEVFGNSLGAHSHHHETLHSPDAQAQQSQSSAYHIANATRASDRWDGIRRKPMFYGQTRATSDSYSDYQEYQH